MPSVIESTTMTKSYGPGGINDVTFAVDEGEVFGFLGPNGAGKTTTIGRCSASCDPPPGRPRSSGSMCGPTHPASMSACHTSAAIPRISAS